MAESLPRLTGRARSAALLALLGAIVLVLFSCGSSERDRALPVRAGERTVTSYSVPHVQHFVDPVPEVDAELRRRVALLPGIELRESVVSITGTVGLWLGDDLDLVDPAAILREREFAHIHPDGSLHAILPVDRALDATAAKWAELHPWVGREDFWDGMVMLYTPQTMDELDVTWTLIVDSYNFVTGQDVDADQAI